MFKRIRCRMPRVCSTWAVERIESDTFGAPVVHLVTADETASACPSCGVLSVCLKRRVCTRPRDIPYRTRGLRLIWHKRRWRSKERLCPHCGVDWSIVHAAFVEHVRVPLAAPLPPVKVLGIDETRRGKPVWAKDPDTGRWVLAADRSHTGFTGAAGTGGMLAQVEGRTSAATIAWLNTQPATWRAAMTHVSSTCQPSYAKAVRALPEAVLVADRFHLSL